MWLYLPGDSGISEKARLQYVPPKPKLLLSTAGREGQRGGEERVEYSKEVGWYSGVSRFRLGGATPCNDRMQERHTHFHKSTTRDTKTAHNQ